MNKKLYQSIAANLDMAGFEENTRKLHALERSICHRDFDASTRFCMEALKRAGFSDVERIALKCDGRTAYGDSIMPEAWDLTGRSYLEIVAPELPEAERMLADSAVQSVSAVTWSGPTPPEGSVGELVAWDALDQEHPDVRGKFVFCLVPPGGRMYDTLARAGALGFVASNLKQGEEYPDEVRWMNGIGRIGWYHVREDLKLPVFSITPRRAAKLAARLAAGEKITVKGVMNTRIYDGGIYTVTARIPGASAKEFALFAHLYEPFLPDDAAGFAGAAEIGRVIKMLADAGKIAPLRYSLRVVFSMEHYGFEAYLQDRKRADNILGALNMDSFCHRTYELLGVPLQQRLSAACLPFFGDFVMSRLLQDHAPELRVVTHYGNLSDDTFGSDPMLDVPTTWLTTPAGDYHHNTGAAFYDVDWPLAEKLLALLGTYSAILVGGGDGAAVGRVVTRAARRELSAAVAGLKREKLSCYDARIKLRALCDYQIGRVRSLERFFPTAALTAAFRETAAAIAARYRLPEKGCYEFNAAEYRAANCVVTRLTPVLPFSQARVPYDERRRFANMGEPLLFALFDGRRTLLEAVKTLSVFSPKNWSAKDYTDYMEYLRFLEKYGYIAIRHPGRTDAAALRRALRELGVGKGDKMVVHSTFSALGEFAGGPEAFCRELMDAVGGQGVLMMPAICWRRVAFTHEGFDYRNSPSLVGAVTECFRTMPGVVRSLDPTHSCCVWGAEAVKYVEHHHQLPTMHRDSPLGLLEQAGGYALMVACSTAVTFMHVVETANAAPCLGSRTEELTARLPDGREVTMRGWGWRNGPCRALRHDEIYRYLRKKGQLAETMLNDAHLLYFKLADYRAAYARLLQGSQGCRGCKVRPRQVPFTVKSDWNDRGDRLKKTTAFVDAVDFSTLVNPEK